MDNVWDLTKLKHEEKDRPSDLMLEVSKLMNNVEPMAKPFPIILKDTYIEKEVTRLIPESTRKLKNHLMNTLFIMKLASTFKENSKRQIIWLKL